MADVSEGRRAEAISGRTEIAHATVASVIAQHVALRPRHPAFVASRGETLSYGALGTQILAFGEILRSAGIGPSARVAILIPDALELGIVIIAAACHAIAVPLNPKITAVELDSLFNRLRIDAIVTSKNIDTPIRAAAALRGIPLFEVATLQDGQPIIAPLGGSVTAKEVTDVERATHPCTTAVILQTSATTGRPKLVPVTHGNLVINAERRRQWFNLTPDDRGLSVMPFYYGQGLKAGLVTPLLLGATIVFPDRDADGDIVNWLADLQPTWYDSAGQLFHTSVLECARKRKGAPLHHFLRFILSAGLSAAVRQALEDTFCVPVLETYGLSEAGTVAANSVMPERRKAGTVGMPWPGDLGIRGDDGHLLPPGMPGEIVVRGPVLTPGYLDDEEANRANFIDGWFRTGDLGSIDQQGFLTVLGRIKEFINRGGEKISPYEIERVLLRHSCIRDAAAFSVPHPRLGENVAAAVVLAPGASTSPSEIKAFLSEHLAPFKVPQRVFVKPELPKGATGKTLRRRLSDEAVKWVRDIMPPIAPLQVQILDIWQRLLGRKDIGIDDDFFEIGGDLLLAIQMLCEVEAMIRQRIPPSALKAVFTVRELVEAVVRGLPINAELLTVAKQGQGMPFLFCHGDYTTRGFYALKLAELLTCGHPVVLLHPYVDPDPNLRIEEVARAYIPKIIAAHPTGAFCLGGHCNGGLFAWEIAHQLQNLGREIASVVLIDAPSLNARPIFRAIARINRFIVAIAPNDFGNKIARHGMRKIWARSLLPLYGPYAYAIANYVPPKINTKVLCVVSEKSRSEKGFSWVPWVSLSSEARGEYIAGTHLSCVTQHVAELVRVLDKHLSQF